MVKPLLLVALTVTLDADASQLLCQVSPVKIALQVSSEVPAPPPAPVTFKITHVEASQPQIIRIFNLDEGTREIEITHVETNEPQIIRILNPDEGTREIVLPPAP